MHLPLHVVLVSLATAVHEVLRVKATLFIPSIAAATYTYMTKCDKICLVIVCHILAVISLAELKPDLA